MPKQNIPEQQQLIKLLEKLLLVTLQQAGVSQGGIARFLGKGKLWVNEQLKSLQVKGE